MYQPPKFVGLEDVPLFLGRHDESNQSILLLMLAFNIGSFSVIDSTLFFFIFVIYYSS